MQLMKGQRVSLAQLLGSECQNFKVRLSIVGISVDFACFGLDIDNKLLTDDYMVFFNQPQMPCGSVSVALQANLALFSCNLNTLPRAVEHLAFTIAVNGLDTMGLMESGYLKFLSDDQEIACFKFSGDDFNLERSLILGELYRKNGIWRFNAVGQGFKEGLEKLVEYFGGSIEEIDATDFQKIHSSDDRIDITQIAGLSAGAMGSAINYADNVILSAQRGHGFAAEKANHLHDFFSGKNAELIGGNNVKNGADRLVDGIFIQTKYCNSGSKCVAETFENGQFRYWNTNGTPMQIEVPSDMYDSAVQAMEDRIRKGQLKGISDPVKAKDIIKKGEYTYQQVKNIARFGTVESLTYDAVNGVKLAGTAMGISAVMSFAVSIWNGEQWDIALEQACYSGLKVGGIAWVSSVLAAQLGRTGLEQGLRGTTDWIVQQMGPKTAAWLANGLRSGKNIYGDVAMRNVSKLLRGNIVTGVVTTVVLSSVDFVRLFNGRISGAQVFKNVATTASAVAGGTGGWWAGAALGASIGSAVPIIGTAAGGIIGGLLGGFAGGSAASAVASTVLDEFIEDDAKAMLKIIESVFGQLAFDYLLNETDAAIVIDEFQKLDVPDLLRDMYASSDREDYARKGLEPLIEARAKNRMQIKLPSETEILRKTGIIIDQLVTA
ncbi:TerD family protein [Methylovulum psychrotolerans]|uniref:TerD domain-containing protein n=1 Tax=Methylovulum psychrotolerans TaxID=1704499 RepID=A0A1Z4C2J5_9GAMM|nr:TerD family protein [Methylovulum psychrotolerans]ASF47741.1 hypothetical protein CEK71_17640 [Methylovulum psychrotolerans]